MNVWVLTREENEYDQYGEYFVAVFLRKPSKNNIISAIRSGDYGVHGREADDGYMDELAEHLLTEGGRRYPENTWFHLKEVKIYVD